MQEKPLTPYQKTQIAAATGLGLVVTVVAGLAFVFARHVPVVTDASVAAAAAPAPAAGETLRDAVADRPAALPAAMVHSTEVQLDKSWFTTAPKPSPQDLARERLLADASGSSVARVEKLRRLGLGWMAIARRLGWPARSAKLFARTGVLVGQRLARR